MLCKASLADSTEMHRDSCSPAAWLVGRDLSGCMQNPSVLVGAETSQTARVQRHVASVKGQCSVHKCTNWAVPPAGLLP